MGEIPEDLHRAHLHAKDALAEARAYTTMESYLYGVSEDYMEAGREEIGRFISSYLDRLKAEEDVSEGLDTVDAEIFDTFREAESYVAGSDNLEEAYQDILSGEFTDEEIEAFTEILESPDFYNQVADHFRELTDHLKDLGLAVLPYGSEGEDLPEEIGEDLGEGDGPESIPGDGADEPVEADGLKIHRFGSDELQKATGKVSGFYKENMLGEDFGSFTAVVPGSYADEVEDLRVRAGTDAVETPVRVGGREHTLLNFLDGVTYEETFHLEELQERSLVDGSRVYNVKEMLSFPEPGEYDLWVEALDGSGEVLDTSSTLLTDDGLVDKEGALSYSVEPFGLDDVRENVSEEYERVTNTDYWRWAFHELPGGSRVREGLDALPFVSGKEDAEPEEDFDAHDSALDFVTTHMAAFGVYDSAKKLLAGGLKSGVEKAPFPRSRGRAAEHYMPTRGGDPEIST